MNEVFGEELRVDGDFGEKTGAAVQRATSRLRLPKGLRDLNVWRRFLLRSARLGSVSAR